MNSGIHIHEVVHLTAVRRVFSDFSALHLVATDGNGQQVSITLFGAGGGQAPVIEHLPDHIVEAEVAA